MRMLYAALAGVLACSPALGGEMRVQYVDGYFCPDLNTLEALGHYLAEVNIPLMAAEFETGAAMPPLGKRVQNFNEKLSGAVATCLHIQDYVLYKTVGIYKTVWMGEGYPGTVAEIRLPNPDLDPSTWPMLVGVNLNTRFFCGYGDEKNSYCGVQGL